MIPPRNRPRARDRGRPARTVIAVETTTTTTTTTTPATPGRRRSIAASSEARRERPRERPRPPPRRAHGAPDARGRRARARRASGAKRDAEARGGGVGGGLRRDGPSPSRRDSVRRAPRRRLRVPRRPPPHRRKRNRDRLLLFAALAAASRVPLVRRRGGPRSRRGVARRRRRRRRDARDRPPAEEDARAGPQGRRGTHRGGLARGERGPDDGGVEGGAGGGSRRSEAEEEEEGAAADERGPPPRGGGASSDHEPPRPAAASDGSPRLERFASWWVEARLCRAITARVGSRVRLSSAPSASFGSGCDDDGGFAAEFRVEFAPRTPLFADGGVGRSEPPDLASGGGVRRTTQNVFGWWFENVRTRVRALAPGFVRPGVRPEQRALAREAEARRMDEAYARTRVESEFAAPASVRRESEATDRDARATPPRRGTRRGSGDARNRRS